MNNYFRENHAWLRKIDGRKIITFFIKYILFYIKHILSRHLMKYRI
jgi:hypothetical protein